MVAIQPDNMDEITRLLFEINSKLSTLQESQKNSTERINKLEELVESNTKAINQSQGFRKHLGWIVGASGGLIGLLSLILKMLE